MTTSAKKPRQGGSGLPTPVPYTAVSMTREVIEALKGELAYRSPPFYPSLLLGQYVSSTVLVTQTLGVRDMVMGLDSPLRERLQYHMAGWRHGLSAGLQRQSQLTYLGVWIYDPTGGPLGRPEADDLEFLLDDPWFELPGLPRPDPFCVFRSTGQSGALKYRADLIDRHIRRSWKLKVHLL